MPDRVTGRSSGRHRGPRGLARAWFEVVTHPRRFFRTGIAKGDQAPGLTFVMTVVLIEEAVRLSLVPSAIPMVAGSRLGSGLFALGVAVLLVTPAALHLIAGLQTVLLRPFAPDRAGVSETVQVLAYATAPCILVGVPMPWLRVACATYGAGLYLLGLASVHRLGSWEALLAGAIPAWLVFGLAFRGYPGLLALIDRWHVI